MPMLNLDISPGSLKMISVGGPVGNVGVWGLNQRLRHVLRFLADFMLHYRLHTGASADAPDASFGMTGEMSSILSP